MIERLDSSESAEREPVSVTVTCNLCGHDDSRPLFTAQNRRLVVCRRCGLVYVNPWVSERSIYQDESYFTERNQYLARKESYTPFFERILNRIEGFKKAGRLLDVGCGPGLLLEVARKRGWEVHGVEVSEWAARYANQELGLPVVCGELNENQFPGEHFDVIVSNHCLEHVPDPTGLLCVMQKMLNKEGILVIGVPNFGSLMAAIRKDRWMSLLPEQHRWHFTPQTLNRMLAKTGFMPVDSHFENHDYRGCRLHNRVVAGVIGWTALRLKRGEAMLVVAKKS